MCTEECKKKSAIFIDRISNLPKNVIEGILMCLPTTDAVQTSILSRDWRYSWSSIPQLTFSRNDFPMLDDTEIEWEYNHRLVKIIDQVLLLHCGPIHKFELSLDMESCSDVDRWILFLSRNGIREIIIEFWMGEQYQLPSCLFSCEGITHLQLQWCIFIPPPFTRFPNLRFMYLSGIDISEDGFEAFVTNCPLLETLELTYVSGCSGLKVCSGSLLQFLYEGYYIHISFENTPMLASVCVVFSEVDNEEGPTPSSPNYELFDALDNLLGIEKLILYQYTLEVWAVRDVPANLRMAYNLKHLAVDMDFEAEQEASTLFLLFKSCPFLSSLNIWVFSSDDDDQTSAEDFWDKQEGLHNLFCHLKNVDLIGIKGTRSELMFIKTVLTNARDLRILDVECHEDVNNEMMMEMIKFTRTCTKAQIIVKNQEEVLYQ
ncbi:F-box/FBD/LRR-repeat protein [Canna indica]|uniref:F-box/FBD/LRR-repeat protein n=1 Tax=Canna indica TaxID=4628 RepID=A0AAQ3QFR5_9LILI|nr:F-box/FBD/LRR-repeat protein [Canna indica]